VHTYLCPQAVYCQLPIPGNTGNLLEFEIAPGNTGNLLEFS